MKKTITIFLFAFIVCLNAMAQNVGVGTNTPTQKLDVAGNINTTGNLMVNGVAGANGQVLTMNGSTMQWMDKSRFNSWAIFSTPVTGATWTVPNGVTEILVEMWGAGGGSHNPGGGGGSGGFFIGLIPVTPNTPVTINVGAGGSGGISNVSGGQGGASRFVYTGFNIIVNGGFGADSLHAGSQVIFSGGSAAGIGLLNIPAGFSSYFTEVGNNGEPSRQSVMQVSSTVFATMLTGGVGGVAAYSGQVPDKPTYAYSDGTSSIRGAVSVSARKFGAGGSATVHSGAGTASGGDGLVIIYY